ncbi:hypothetical protein U6A24_21230 [Aquimarina gracilis]|uniref:Natural product n=1 Tax=Aquimarina gracilis TaxID=874422 RepID=A0ABU6A1I0_9FLAO|nr:hypothetical protein [Aquimarina gracilis]MEB3348012.1 hypothetical protein [Aquimarina gracilis]
MKNKRKKLDLKKCTITSLEMRKVNGGVVDSCLPTCNTHPTTPTDSPTGQSNMLMRCEVITRPNV